MFESILGNEPIKAFLQKALLENRLPQTLLFTGPDGVGKSLFAKALGAHLLQSNRSADLHLLKPEGKVGLYSIDSLREMIDRSHAAPYESSGKVFILDDADRMQPASANILLKTLEEPSADTTFILLSSHPQEILSTILSRCAVFHFQPLSEGEIRSLLKLRNYPAHFAKLAHGSAGRAFELAEHPEFEEHQKILFSLLANSPSYPELTAQLVKLEELIEEGSEDDPVRKSRRIEHLFSFILMWHRDQHVRKIGGREELLFFSEESRFEPVDLRSVEKSIDRARSAIQRNMKLSLCLQSCLRSELT